MRRRGRVLPVTAGISAVLMIAAHGASLEDGKAVFARREDTMKHMGRPLFLGIGRVVKGTAAYGPDTVTAADGVASLAGTLDRTREPPALGGVACLAGACQVIQTHRAGPQDAGPQDIGPQEAGPASTPGLARDTGTSPIRRARRRNIC